MAAFIMSQSQYKFNHTIKFVAFSGEEQGLLGSRAYVAEAVDKGWNIVGVLNADMISYAETTNEGNYLIVFQNDASEWLYNYTLDISSKYTDYIQLTPLQAGLSGGSDHYSFWQQGYDALFYYESRTTPYYHTSDDTVDHINATYAAKNIRLMLATLVELSEARFFNTPPNIPAITGETNGAIQISYNYTIQTIDSDQDDVQYYINWGDNTTTITDSYKSEEKIIVSHIWDTEGTYTIQVKAIDEYNAESDWATLTVTMPYSYNKSMPQFLELFFERFSNAFPILRQLLE
jgi:hypothetical protein